MFEELKKIDSGEGSTLGDYKFLYGFVSMIRPKTIVEIGTNRGGSAIAMAMALRDEGLKKSRIVSIDINEVCIKSARKQLKQLDLLRYVVLIRGESSLIQDGQFFDMAFIDGDHTHDGCLTDFNNLKDKATYILIHDSSQETGTLKMVEDIEKMEEYTVLNLKVGNQGTQWSLGRPKYHAFPGVAIIKRRLIQ